MKFTRENVFLNVDSKDKEELLRFISSQAQKINLTNDSEKLLESFEQREQEYSTGLQDGFAIPHAKSDVVNNVGIIYVRLSNPIAWKTYDDKPVIDVFALMVPTENAGTTHLKMLANLSTALLEDDFKVELRKKDNEKDIANYISEKIGAKEL